MVVAVTGFLVLDETPTVHTAVGFGFVLAAFCLLKRDAIRAEVTRLRRPATAATPTDFPAGVRPGDTDVGRRVASPRRAAGPSPRYSRVGGQPRPGSHVRGAV